MSRTVGETAIGMCLAAGIEGFFGRFIRLGFGMGYHAVSSFDQPIGDDDNYGGPEFSIGLGVMLGRGR
jgi:hypothetical protein